MKSVKQAMPFVQTENAASIQNRIEIGTKTAMPFRRSQKLHYTELYWNCIGMITKHDPPAVTCTYRSLLGIGCDNGRVVGLFCAETVYAAFAPLQLVFPGSKSLQN